MDSTSTSHDQYYSNLFNSGGSIRFSRQTSNQSSSSWLSSVTPTKQTFTLLAVIGAGLTLIGATTYFLATRLMHKKRDAKTHLDLEEDTEQYLDISDDEDFRMRLSSSRKRRGQTSAYRPSPLITFSDLYEQALTMHRHRNS